MSSETVDTPGRWFDKSLGIDLSIIFIAISAMLPWNFVYATPSNMGILQIQWWFGQYISMSDGPFTGFQVITKALTTQQGTSVYQAYLLWAAMGVITIGILIWMFSLMFEINHPLSDLSDQSVSDVTGGLLLLSGTVFIITAIVMSQTGFPGIYAPVGALIQLVLGGLLYTN